MAEKDSSGVQVGCREGIWVLVHSYTTYTCNNDIYMIYMCVECMYICMK